MPKLTKYQKLPVELQKLVQQMILTEAQKGSHPLSHAQIGQITDTVYDTLIGGQEEDSVKPEDELTVSASNKDTGEVATFTADADPTWLDEKVWAYEGINGTGRFVYYMYTHKTEPDLWRIRRDDKVIYGYANDIKSLPPEIVAQLIEVAHSIKK